MMRIAWIELRRSNARAVALLIVAISAAALATHLGYWLTGWTRFANDQASALFVLVPIVLAGGAMLGRRERRTRADELLAGTARPRLQRITPAVAALAIAVVAAHLLVFAAGGALVAGNSGYTGLSSVLVPVTDSVILIGGAWLGFAAGRSWPSPLVPPALAAGGLLLQLGLSMAEPPGELTRLDNVLPLVQPPSYDWEMVTGRALLGHLALGAGLAGAGLLLAAARRWPVRLVAAPIAAAGIAAAALIPGTGLTGRYYVDRDAQRLVCAPGDVPVCVTAVHQHLLASAAPQVRHALTLLAKLPGAPRQAMEWRAATVYEPGGADPAMVPVAPGTVVFQLEDDQSETKLVESIVWAAGTSHHDCPPADDVASGAAGAWLMGADDIAVDEPPALAEKFHERIRKTVRDLRRLPAAEQTARVTALRDAAAACRTDLLPILTGNGAR